MLAKIGSAKNKKRANIACTWLAGVCGILSIFYIKAEACSQAESVSRPHAGNANH